MPSLGSSNPMGSMGSFGMPPNRQYGSQGTMNSFHSVFGVSGDNNTPPLLDLNEFPSLTNRGQGDSMPQPSPMPGKQPYGMESLFLLYYPNLMFAFVFFF